MGVLSDQPQEKNFYLIMSLETEAEYNPRLRYESEDEANYECANMNRLVLKYIVRPAYGPED